MDPNEVAALADGLGPSAPRALLASRLLRDPEAWFVVQALRRDRARARVLRRAAASAAILVVGLTVAWAARRDAAHPPSFRERLAASAAEAARAAPDLLGGLVLLPPEAPPPPEARRGAGAWIHPAGLLLEAPREFRWRLPLGATRVRIVLAEVGRPGERTQEVEGDATSDLPPLAPGRYVVRLSALDALAGQEIRRTFSVLASDAAERHRAAMRTLRELAPPDLAPFLVAHYALQERLFAEAERALAALGEPRATGAEAEEAALRGHLSSRMGGEE